MQICCKLYYGCIFKNFNGVFQVTVQNMFAVVTMTE